MPLMQFNYRFRIQPLFGGVEPCFRLVIGMAEDRDFEMIPAHLSAFAHRLSLKEFHQTEAEVQIELTNLLHLLEGRKRLAVTSSTLV